MGIKFFDWLRRGNATAAPQEVSIDQFFESAAELQIRILCWNICVNMVANAVGRCEFRTFANGEETFDKEYYLWNYEPNTNENSTAFLHHLINTLYVKNEALIVEGKKSDRSAALIVADDWAVSDYIPEKPNEYNGVISNNYTFKKTFFENDVLHLKLNHISAKPALDSIARNYATLASMATEFIKWSQGHHWKVHISQMMEGDDEWQTKFMGMLTTQLKPFLTGNAAVLPEFDGYAYSDVRSERVYQSANGETATLRNLVEDIFNFTAQSFLIPIVLVNGKVEATADANKRFLTNVIDPICDQLQEEATRKRFGYRAWKNGSYMKVDSSSIIHFDLFDAAAGIEKLVGSGAFNINDIRKAAGQAPINEPWADHYFLTKNIASVEEGMTALNAQKGGDA